MQAFKSKKFKIIISLLGGVFVGFLNGFFGGGGGMVVVPLLIFLLGLKEKQAHATAIFCILPLSITSSIIYITQANLNLNNLLFVSIGVIVGGIIGSLILKKINNKVLRVIFALIMIIAGVKLMF
ncbi:MAG: sulfite exporter TauE/SafE family protein [Clostridiales bacterium]|nr:sulfite exporter TauE/SafE family protein [Clostridiales bacterium]